MGQKCCSLLTGRPIHEEAPLHPHLLAQPWHHSPATYQQHVPAPNPQYGASPPPCQQNAPAPYPQWGASPPPRVEVPQLHQTAGHPSHAKVNCSTYGCMRPPWNGRYGEACCRTCTKSAGVDHGPECNRSYQAAGYKFGHPPNQKVHCSTPGCTRPPWNGAYGEACCRTCSKSAGVDHGPDCNRRIQGQVELVPLAQPGRFGFGYGQPAPGPPMPQASDAICRSCNNTGRDFTGNLCACRAGPNHGVKLSDIRAASAPSAPPCIVLGRDAGQLAELGGFTWILKFNDPEHRQLRLDGAKKTQQACATAFYQLEDVQVPLKCLRHMCANTRLVFSRDAVRQAPCETMPHLFTHRPGQSADVALKCTRSGLRTSLVNASSSYHVGGGFLSGGRHALEESLCMQSTLFQSLQTASGHTHECYHQPYIPEKAVVLSPDVEFFRSGSLDGYRFQKRTECIAAVVSVAMPNRNSKVEDAPVDAPVEREAYLELLHHKFVAVLAAAACVHSSAVVIPDVGCGVYENNPLDIGSALGRAIRMYFPCHFSEIHLVGSETFANAAKCS